MKKFIVLTVLSSLFCLGIKAQNELYEKYSDKKGMNTTLISEIKDNLKNMIDDESVSKVADGLNCVCILETVDSELIEDLSKDVEKYIKKYKLNVLITQTKNGNKTIIYSGKKENNSEMVLVKWSDTSYKVIMINGSISFVELKNIDGKADDTAWLMR